jgi:glutamyl-Q tRNA(Asp) synthetase
LRCIEAFGFQPDAEIIFQKDRLDLYEDVIQQLHQLKVLTFPQINLRPSMGRKC